MYLSNMVCLKYVIVSTLVKVIGGGGDDDNDDDDDDDDNSNNNNNNSNNYSTWNVKTKVVAVIGGVTGTISESFR